MLYENKKINKFKSVREVTSKIASNTNMEGEYDGKRHRSKDC